MVLLGSAGLAEAILIDFRNAPFDITAKGQPSFTATVAGVGDVTLTAFPDGSPAATLWWDSVDGFGVQYSYEADEVEAGESLLLSFSTAVHLNEIHLTDLFSENGYIETGSYSLDGGTPVGFSADPGEVLGSGSNGVRTLLVGGTLVSSVRFTAPGLTNCTFLFLGCENHEYALAGVEVTAVPEPATLLLMGTGLAGLGLWRRRRA